jgi:hypothetical protein
MAEKCTKTSSPFSREIKPKPLASLNHLTVPFSMLMFLPLLEFSAEEESLPR